MTTNIESEHLMTTAAGKAGMKTEPATGLWVLRITAPADYAGNLMRAIDSTGDPVLAFGTARDARKAARYHAKAYDIQSTPERVTS